MTKLLRDTGHSDEESELEARGREPQLESESQPAPSQRTTRVVLDTSVLIADPNCLLAYPNCDIVIPLTVIEELDGLKSRPDDVGRAARAALRGLEDIRMRAGGSLAHPVRLVQDDENTATVHIEINGILCQTRTT